jgi:hypothetical protein
MERKMSWKPEFVMDFYGQWTDNGLRFGSQREAELWATYLKERYPAVREIRVVECYEGLEPTRHRLVMGQVVDLPEETIPIFH